MHLTAGAIDTVFVRNYNPLILITVFYLFSGLNGKRDINSMDCTMFTVFDWEHSRDGYLNLIFALQKLKTMVVSIYKVKS